MATRFIFYGVIKSQLKCSFKREHSIKNTMNFITPFSLGCEVQNVSNQITKLLRKEPSWDYARVVQAIPEFSKCRELIY